MKSFNSRILCTLAASMAVMLSAPPAVADDSEVFTSSAFANGALVRPNVLFVIDTSGSMNDQVISYDSTYSYTGVCDKDKIYWHYDDGSTPPNNCVLATKYIKVSDNRCRAAYESMAGDGWWRGRVAQLNGTASTWQDIQDGRNSRAVECELDNGKHGDLNPAVDDSGSNTYARYGSETGQSNRWGTSRARNLVTWRDFDRVSFYSGNYINWYNTVSGGATEGSKIKTRLQIVKQVANDMIGTLQGVNVGIVRYSNNEGADYEKTAEGGMVSAAVQELTDANRTTLQAKVTAFVGAGNTPLSETLYEAMLYMSGGTPKYGNSSRINKDTEELSVDEARVSAGGDYKSPMNFSCQNNFIVYLTDGLPTADNSADANILALDKFATEGFVPESKGGTDTAGACPDEGPDGTTRGRCLVNLAGYMQNHDFRDDVDGKQNISTYMIGFGSDIQTSKTFLEQVAAAGGGKAYTQTDAAGLKTTLQEIFADVADKANSTFVSPTVAVNAFNRTRNLDTLFVSVFAPSKKLRWPGNLKKYKFVDGKITGTAGVDAIDPLSGFFTKTTQDYFNADSINDGPDVTLGGAASRLDSAKRKIYTYMGTNPDLTSTSNTITTTNLAVLAQLGMPASPVPTAADIQAFINFIYGADSYDEDGKPATTERKAMGDPMRTRPAVGIYGGTETAPEGVVFTTTNDGVLHATDMSTGNEDWAFIPPEFLGRQWELKTNAQTAGHRYGLDGDVRLFKYDVNGDGIIDTTKDKMWAVFGFGRGGTAYYALDVTLRGTPKFLWMKDKLSPGFEGLGQTWSAPVITRVNVGGGGQTDPQKFVAIFGGGYDKSQENYNYTTDSSGNGIYMVELTTGKLLWSAGISSSTTANLKFADMNNSIPSDINVLDLTGDGYADRMYVGDMGGRIWRFDIWHSQAPKDLVSGGIIATLGAGHITTTPDIADARRFYYAPDVSVVTPRGSAPYLNIAIGSGYRGHPLDDEIKDSFFSLRDYQPFNRRTTASYGTPTVMTDLVNVTAKVNTVVPDGSAGWVLDMNADGWVGEKVLAESVTANGVIFFPSFTPTGVDKENPCLRTTLNRTYAVYLDSAKPFGLRDGVKPGDPPLTADPKDRYSELKQGGIAPGLAIIQTPDNKTLCLEGVESLGRCVNIGDVTRTFWERRQ